MLLPAALCRCYTLQVLAVCIEWTASSSDSQWTHAICTQHNGSCSRYLLTKWAPVMMEKKKHFKTKQKKSPVLSISAHFFTFSVRKETLCPGSNPNEMESLKRPQLLSLWNDSKFNSFLTVHTVDACGSPDWSWQTDNPDCCKPVARINVAIGYFCKLLICWICYLHQGGYVFTCVHLFVGWLVGLSAGSYTKCWAVCPKTWMEDRSPANFSQGSAYRERFSNCLQIF